MKIDHCISRRGVLRLGAGAAGAMVVGQAGAAQPPLTAVVELFTSQACSSCPPADEILTDIRTMPGVVALAYHVDYWDYLGWKDTLGAPEFSQRQYDYAKARGDMDVYTPQVIVNGESHYVGSHKADLLAAVERAAKRQLSAPIELSDGANDIAITVGEGAVDGETMVWLLPVQAKATVKIERGENSGRTIDYYNVVRRIVPAGMWSGGPATFRLPADTVMLPGCTGCVALLQKGKAGPVLGVATAGQITA
jgi:hypothetical protein